MKLLWHKTTTKVFGDRHIKNEDVFSRGRFRGEDINRFVMCDGATSSYAARAWATALVSNFAEEGNLSDEERVYGAARAYEKEYPPTALAGLDHCTIEAFKRGSSATLLLIVQDKIEHNILHVTAVGDTCCFVVDEKFHIRESFPLTHAEDFSTSAYLLTVTCEGLKQLFDEKACGYYWKKVDIDMSQYPSAKVICATDAVSQWIVKNKEYPESIARLIKAVKNSKRGKFVRFIEYERGRKMMSVDDSSVAILEM